MAGAAAGEGRYAPHRHHRVATLSPHPVAAIWCLPAQPSERRSRRSGPTRASTSTPRVRVACRHQNACILQVSRSLTIACLMLVCCDCHRSCRLHFAGDEERGVRTMSWRPKTRCGRRSDEAHKGPMRSRVCADEAEPSRLLMTSPGGGHPRAGVLPVGQAPGLAGMPGLIGQAPGPADTRPACQPPSAKPAGGGASSSSAVASITSGSRPITRPAPARTPCAARWTCAPALPVT